MTPETQHPDWICLDGIAAQAVVGVYDFERTALRPLQIDLAMAADLRAAGNSDDVADTIDYDAATAVVRDLCGRLQPALIETLAEAIAARLLAEFPLHAVAVTVHKPGAVPGVAGISVRILRQRGA